MLGEATMEVIGHTISHTLISILPLARPSAIPGSDVIVQIPLIKNSIFTIDRHSRALKYNKSFLC